MRIDDDLRGFPWYGFAVDLVVGQWLAADEGIPLATLRDKHEQINMPCKAQSYSLRSAFFDHLGKTYGDDKILAMARQEKAGAVGDYEKFLGNDSTHSRVSGAQHSLHPSRPSKEPTHKRPATARKHQSSTTRCATPTASCSGEINGISPQRDVSP